MRLGIVALLLSFGSSVALAGERVYLVASITLGGSSLSQSIFLHEPEITDLAGCQAALSRGQQANDWLHYHHILRRDKMQGFTAQPNYRCVLSALTIEPWYDRSRYDFAYLISIDAASRLQIRRFDTQAACTAWLAKAVPVAGVQRYCARSNQQVDD